MINTEVAGVADAPTADPEIRITAHVFERVHGVPPAALRRVHGGLRLLGGPGAALAVALPWGVIIAAGATADGAAELYSMNRHADSFATGRGRLPTALATGAVPLWAAPAVTALLAHSDPAPGARLVVNRELPVEMGLLTGQETVCAVALGLGDLYGPPAATAGYEPERDPSYAASLHAREGHAMLVGDGAVRHLPCDLAAAGLRMLIMDVGAGAEPAGAAVPAQRAGGLVERAEAVLRGGDLAGLGPLLTEGHVRGEPLLDVALDTARAAGALGGLVLGRCGLVLVPMTAVPGVRAQVTARLAGMVSRPPRFLTAVPSGV